MKCTNCGGEEFVLGRAELGGRGGFQFRPGSSKLMVLSWPEISAAVCRKCGNVHFTVDTDKLKSVLKE
jgi:predicted nucleic-acid-binding Zn-ribbon protein